MNINMIVSCVILPHGITDLTQCNIKDLPSLFMIYLSSLFITYLSSFIYKYLHLYIFIISSFIHFKKDFIYLKFTIRLSYLLSFTILLMCFCLSYYNLLLAKKFMITYMILFHIPLHYKKISIKMLDLASILFFTLIFGLFIPKKLEYIENNNLDSIESITLISLVLGHTLWNIN